MPVLDETRVISEDMEEVYGRLRAALRQILESGESP
jgi:hypothetical protein